MADGATIDEIKAVLTAELDNFLTNMNKAKDVGKDTTDKINEQFKKMGDGMKQVGEKISLFISLPLELLKGEAVKSWGAQEDAQVSMAAALANTGEYTKKNVEQFIAFANQMQESTKYSNDFILSQMAMAKNMGIQTNKLEDTTKAALGLSSAYGMDMNTAFRLIIEAGNGMTGMLSRYGIIVDQNASKQEKLNAVMKIGMNGFNIARANALTMTGSLTQLKNSFDDFLKVVGEQMAPVIQGVAQHLKIFTESLQHLNPHIIQIGIVVTGLIAALGPLLFIAGSLITTFAQLKILIGSEMYAAFMKMAAGIATTMAEILLFAAIGLVVVANWQKVKNLLMSIVDGIAAGFLWLTQQILKFISVIVPIADYIGPFKKLQQGVKQATDDMSANFTKTAIAVNDGGDWIGNTTELVSKGMDKMMGVIKKVGPTAMSMVNATNTAVKAAQKTLDPFTKFFDDWARKMASTSENFAKEISKNFEDMATNMVVDLSQGTFDAGQALMGFLTFMLKATVDWAIKQLGIFELLSQGIAAALSNPLVAVVAIAGLIGAIAALSASMGSSYKASVPKYGDGGIADSPQLAQIGEKGPEAIFPVVRTSSGKMGIRAEMPTSVNSSPQTNLSSVQGNKTGKGDLNVNFNSLYQMGTRREMRRATIYMGNEMKRRGLIQ